MVKKTLAFLFLIPLCIKAQTPFTKIVAADGSGDYTTVQAAVNSCTSGQREFIFVKNGTYEEQVTIPSGILLSLLGENRDKTVITHCLSHATVDDEAKTSTIYLNAADFYGENFTSSQTAGRNGGQAECLTVNADRATFRNVALCANQDGVRLNSSRRSYFKDCYIEGTVDYIFDSGVAFFDDCTIHQLYEGYVAAPSECSATITRTDSKALTGQNKIWGLGLFFRKCKLTYNAANITPNKSHLGRPWGKTTCAAYYINCYMDKHIIDEGWCDMGNHVANGTKAYVGEFGSMDMNGKKLDLSKRISWEFTEDAGHNSQYITQDVVDKLFSTEYVYAYVASQNKFCSGEYNPLPLVVPCGSPSTFGVSGKQLSWSPVEGAAGYLIYKNGSYLANVKEPGYTDSSTEDGEYTLCTVSNSGCMSDFISFKPTGISSLKQEIAVRQIGEELFWDQISDVSLFNAQGSVVKQENGVESLSLKGLPTGVYILELNLATGCVKKKIFIAQ